VKHDLVRGTDVESACGTASANLTNKIDVGSRFPRNVFVGNWARFFFFDPDWMLEPDFVSRVKAFLDVENSKCACLSLLDTSPHVTQQQQRSLHISRQTGQDEYNLLLEGSGPGMGWIYEFGRFGCTSDIGQWCIYCEASNEIAVVAIQRDVLIDGYMPLLDEIKALPIRDAIGSHLSYGFTDRVITSEWRLEFEKEYGFQTV
jgi:hypothetical protein